MISNREPALRKRPLSQQITPHNMPKDMFADIKPKKKILVNKLSTTKLLRPQSTRPVKPQIYKPIS